MKKIIILTLCLLSAGSCFAAGGVKVNGDLTLSKDVADPYRVMYFSDGSSQWLASPWSYNGSNIFYNPTIPGNIGIGTATPTATLEVNGVLKATQISTTKSSNDFILLQGVVAQSANLMEVRDSTSSIAASFGPSGALSLYSLSAGITPLTITGNPVQSGPLLLVRDSTGITNFTTIFSDGAMTIKSPNAKPFSVTNLAGTSLMNITSAGTINTTNLTATGGISAANLNISSGTSTLAAGGTLSGTFNASGALLISPSLSNTSFSNGTLAGTFDVTAATLNGGSYSGITLNNPIINGGTATNFAISTRYKGPLPISSAGTGGCTLSGTTTQVVNCPGTVSICQTYSAVSGLTPSRCSQIADPVCKKYCLDNSSGGQNSTAVSQKLQFNSAGSFTVALDKGWVCMQNGNVSARINTAISYCPDSSAAICNSSPPLVSQSSLSVPFGTNGFVFIDSPYTSPVTDSLISTPPQNIQIWLTANTSTLTGTGTTCWLVQKNQLASMTNPTIDVILTPYAAMGTW